MKQSTIEKQFAKAVSDVQRKARARLNLAAKEVRKAFADVKKVAKESGVPIQIVTSEEAYRGQQFTMSKVDFAQWKQLAEMRQAPYRNETDRPLENWEVESELVDAAEGLMGPLLFEIDPGAGWDVSNAC